MEVKQIWESFNIELRNYVARRVADQNLVDDIVQDIFEKVTKNIQRLNNVENMQEYLYKIARNTVIDSFRTRKLVLVDFDEDPVFSLGDPRKADAGEQAHSESLNTLISKSCITPFIEKLPPKYREALIASEINNVSQKDLAIQLNISYSGAKSRVQRGREKLKTLLQECCNFEHDAYGNLIKSNSRDCGC